MSLLGYSTPETLTDDAGNALKGITVTVTGPSAYSGSAVTDSTSGVLRLGPLPVGDYTVTLGSRSVTVPVLAGLPAGGADGQVVTQSSGVPGWSTPTGGGGTAATTTFTPTGSIAATNVQAALAEVATEYAAADTAAVATAASDATSKANAAQAAAIAAAATDATTKANAAQSAATSAAATDATSKVGTETTRATTAEALKAPLASPTFTGTPAAPTAAPGTNTTQLATTAFVAAQSATQSTALVPTAVKTSSYTAAASDYVPVDTTSGNVTITLPTAPADKTQVGIKHVVRGGTNTVTLALGGSDVLNKTGGSTTGTLTLVNQAIVVQYKASGAIWYVVSGELPLSGLDARYDAAGAAATAVSALVAGAPGALDTLNELAVALTADEGAAATLTALVATKTTLAGDISGTAAVPRVRKNRPHLALTTLPNAFAPSLMTGLIRSYVASALALADAASVTSWADASGSGVALTNPGTAPTYKLDAVNGRPAVRFAGNTVLSCTITSPPTSWTIVLASNFPNNATSEYNVGGSSGIACYTPLNLLRFGTSLGNTVSAQGVSSQAVWALTCDGTTTTVFRNGRRLGAFANTVTLSSLVLGGSSSSASPGFGFTGDIEEAHVWSRAMTLEEINQVSTYVGKRIGVTVVPSHNVRTTTTPTVNTQATRILFPEDYVPGAPHPLVIHSHGSGGNQEDIYNNGSSARLPMIDALLTAGFIVASSAEEGGSNWGNDAALADTTALINYIHSNYGGITGTVATGSSMGGLLMLRLAAAQATPGGILGVCGFSAVTDLAGAFYGGFTSAIVTAYGITKGTLSSAYTGGAATLSSSVSFTAGHQIRVGGSAGQLGTVQSVTGAGPYTVTLVTPLASGVASGQQIDNFPQVAASADPNTATTSLYTGLRYRAYTSASDVTVSPSNSTTFATKIAAVAKENTVIANCLGGHLDVSQYQPLEVAQFALRCLA